MTEQQKRRIEDRLPTEKLDWEDPDVKAAKEHTRLANAMAAAGAALLAHTRTAAALAAIPNTSPQQYVAAGTLAMIAKVLPSQHDAAVEALRPFAELAELFDEECRTRNMPDSGPILSWQRPGKNYALTVEHLCVAREVRAVCAAGGSTDWRVYHSALSQCAELLDNMPDGHPITDTPRFLAATLEQLQASRSRVEGGHGEQESSTSAPLTAPAPLTASQFKDENDLITWLDGLYECDENGAAYNQKWAPAQRAIAALRAAPAPQQSELSDEFKSQVRAEFEALVRRNAGQHAMLERHSEGAIFNAGRYVDQATDNQWVGYSARAAEEVRAKAAPAAPVQTALTVVAKPGVRTWQERTGNHNIRPGSVKHMIAEITDLRAALASEKTAPVQAEQAQAEPTGYKLVPRVPTPEMLDAAHHAENCGHGDKHFTNAYRAMIAVAPALPAQAEQAAVRAAYENAAKVADSYYYGPCGEYDYSYDDASAKADDRAERIAAAIRALAKEAAIQAPSQKGDME